MACCIDRVGNSSTASWPHFLLPLHAQIDSFSDSKAPFYLLLQVQKSMYELYGGYSSFNISDYSLFEEFVSTLIHTDTHTDTHTLPRAINSKLKYMVKWPNTVTSVWLCSKL